MERTIGKPTSHRWHARVITSFDLQGAAVANVESEADLHEICVPQLLNSGGATLDSGLLFAAAETEKVGSYYIPHLGPTPKWASFLDSITEELEENNETAIYEDYKFVTRDELRRLGLDHLRGTQMLKAYMHGFFIDSKLYARVRAVADPEEFTKWRKARYVAAVLLKGDFTLDRITKKIHAQRGSRIAASKPKQPSAPVSAAVAADDRFAKLFTEDSFRIDQEVRRWVCSTGVAGLQWHSLRSLRCAIHPVSVRLYQVLTRRKLMMPPRAVQSSLHRELH